MLYARLLTYESFQAPPLSYSNEQGKKRAPNETLAEPVIYGYLEWTTAIPCDWILELKAADFQASKTDWI